MAVRFRIACVVSLGLAQVLVAARAHGRESISPRLARFYGEQAARAISQATKVEAIRLKGAADGRHGFVVESRTTLRKAALLKYRRVILRPESFDFPDEGVASIKLCGHFEPGVLLRFYDLRGAVDLLLCFKCSELGVMEPAPGPALKIGNPYDVSKDIQRLDMKPGERDLLGLIVGTFPRDEELLALALERHVPVMSRLPARLPP
jgi:hypothetical protein